VTRLCSTSAPPNATNHHRPLPRTTKSSFANTKQVTDPHTNKPYPPMNTVDLLKSHESKRSNRGEVDGRKQNTQISRAEEEGAGGRRISTLPPASSGQAGLRAQRRRSVREESGREERGTNPRLPPVNSTSQVVTLADTSGYIRCLPTAPAEPPPGQGVSKTEPG